MCNSYCEDRISDLKEINESHRLQNAQLRVELKIMTRRAEQAERRALRNLKQVERLKHPSLAVY